MWRHLPAKAFGEEGSRVRSGDPLVYAAANGKADAARCLVKELKADVNKAGTQGLTPLTIATQLKGQEMMKCLVKELGADVNLADTLGNTPLTSATMQKDLEVMKCLVKELGADVNLANTKAFAPLFRALRNNDVDVARYLVKELGADVNQADTALLGSTALSQAILAGDIALVQCLVGELDADVNLELEIGAGTPLMIAAINKHPKIVKYLIKQGANTQATCTHGIPGHYCTAVNMSRNLGGPAEQTAYLEAKTHCSNPGCDGAGRKKCTGCKQARYCGKQCQLAHWPAHKIECKEAGVHLAAKSM
jgi:ankyrin repeat protein